MLEVAAILARFHQIFHPNFLHFQSHRQGTCSEWCSRVVQQLVELSTYPQIGRFSVQGGKSGLSDNLAIWWQQLARHCTIPVYWTVLHHPKPFRWDGLNKAHKCSRPSVKVGYGHNEAKLPCMLSDMLLQCFSKLPQMSGTRLVASWKNLSTAQNPEELESFPWKSWLEKEPQIWDLVSFFNHLTSSESFGKWRSRYLSHTGHAHINICQVANSYRLVDNRCIGGNNLRTIT